MCIVQRTTLDGAWSMKQVCHPMFEPEVFRKQMYCFEKKCSWHCWNFLAPRSDSAPKYRAPLPPSLRLCCYAMKIGKFSENKQIFKSERHEYLQFSKTIRHGSCTDWQQRLLAAFQVSSCSFVSLQCLPHAFLRCGPVFVLLIIKHFGHSTSNFFKVR